MSLILDALKRAQQIRMQRQKRAQIFGTNLPWLSHWRKRWIIPRMLILSLGLAIGVAIALTIYRTGTHGQSTPLLASTSGHRHILPKGQGPPERLQEEITEVLLEEVPLRPVAGPSVEKDDVGTGEKHASPPAREKTPKMAVRAEPKSAPLPAKFQGVIPEESPNQKVKIQPIPSKEAFNHFNLGLLYYKNNKPLEALKEYRKALKLDPSNFQAHNNLGMIYKELGRLPDAVRHYQMAISVHPKYEKAHHNLAVAYYLQGHDEKATLELKRAIDCNPNVPETYNNLGLIYRKKKDLHQAKKMFEKGLSIDFNYAPIHYNLALTLEDEGDSKGAILHYRRFLDLSPDKRPEVVQKVKRHLEVLASYEKE